LNIENPVALWVTLVVGLVSLWLPVMMGLLQGTQNFLWIGWVAIFNGVGRFAAIFLIVKWLGGWAAGAMFGTLLGALVALGVAAWQTRALWLGPGAAFEWREWLLIVGPLTVGLGAGIFMQSFDMIIVRSFFPQNKTELYAAGMKIGFGLIQFTAPVTAVMFPKIARSAALAEKTSVLWQALGVTALVGGGTALGCTIFPELPLKFVYRASFLVPECQQLVAWSVWAMLPLALANVLLNNLMARRRFAAVPWLALVAAGYGVTLYLWHDNFLRVAQVLGVFNVLFLGVCAWFTWRRAPGAHA
jgi:O-antigen/teichoic acid export membrane protein